MLSVARSDQQTSRSPRALAVGVLIALSCIAAAPAATAEASELTRQGEQPAATLFKAAGGGEPGVERLRVAEDADGDRYLPGELIVTYEGDASRTAIRRVNRRVDSRVEDRLPALDLHVLEFPEIKRTASEARAEKSLRRTRRELADKAPVKSVALNYVRETLAVTNDPLFGFQWGLDRIRVPQAWPASLGDKATISILDSGIDVDHPDIGRVVAEGDFVNGDAVGEDNAAHGTHVAGIAAANTYNDRGIAGVAPKASLVNAKVCEYDPSEGTGICPLSAEIAGIVASADFGVDVINLSLGGEGCTEAEQTAVDYAAERGVVLVAAAGNEDASTPTCPAAFGNVIAVSSTDIDNGPSAFSNRGPWIDIAAPGGDIGNPQHEDILSTVPVSAGGYAFYQGTSMASPFVAGVAALLAAQGRTAAEIRRRIETTAIDLPPVGRDNRFGHGLVNARAAVGAASSLRDKVECQRAKRKLEAARERVQRAKRRLRRADTRAERRSARRKLNAAKEARAAARERKLEAC